MAVAAETGRLPQPMEGEAENRKDIETELLNIGRGLLSVENITS